MPAKAFREWTSWRGYLFGSVFGCSLLLGGCRESGPELSHEEGQRVTELAGPAAGELLRTLVTHLTEAMENGGPVAAIEFCSTEAIPITETVQSALADGMQLKRTSYRYRNPENAPDEAEEAALLYFEERIVSGDPPPSSYVQRVSQEEYRYYQPLFLGEVCLGCHGEREVMNPEVRDVLDQEYPADLANGYLAGDFRGLVRVSVPTELVFPEGGA